MADIVNLNRARKARDKVQAKANAASNRIIHGRSRAEKTAARIEVERTAKGLDGARREDGDGA